MQIDDNFPVTDKNELEDLIQSIKTMEQTQKQNLLELMQTLKKPSEDYTDITAIRVDFDDQGTGP